MTTTRRPGALNDPVLWAAMLAVGATLALMSLLSYRGYSAGMLDLGGMTQAIMSVLRGRPLVTTGPTGNFSRLAGHVELIYAAFAPLLALWRDPQPLLVAQAALAAAGAIPAYRLALRRLESVAAARCAALIYLLYPVAQTAVLFDFHGDTLAMPLLMFALDAADRGAWRSFALWAALALSCKLYIAAPVAGIGAYLFLWGGRRRAGLITGVAAVAYGAFVFLVLRELFAPRFLNQSAVAVYTNYYFGAPGLLLETAPDRLLSALAVFAPAIFLAWRGWPWLLVGSPLAVATLLSSGPGSGFHYESHHYAALVPFLVMATIDGAARVRAAAEAGRTTRSWRSDLIFATMIVSLCWVLLVDQPFGPRFWLAAPGDGLDPSSYGLSARDEVKDRFLAEHIPPGASIVASMFLAPHLAERDTLYVTRYPSDPGGRLLPALLPEVEYALADALFDWRLTDDTGAVIGGAAYERDEIGILLRDPAFGLVAARDGLLLFQRGAPAEARLRQVVTAQPQAATAQPQADQQPEPIATPQADQQPEPIATPQADQQPEPIATPQAYQQPEPIATFGPIRLLSAELRHLRGRRYSASFTWATDEDLPEGRDLIPVSTLEGVPGVRMVHLPTFALLPTSAWQPGEAVSERFEVELPADLPPGRYRWLVAWYDPARPEAYATDAASLVPGSAQREVAIIEVTP